MRMFLIALWLGFTVLSAHAQKKQVPPKNDPEVQKILQEAMTKHQVPGMGAAIVTTDGIKVVAVHGVRERNTKFLITLNDRFHLGSCTKMMTAYMLATLVEQKQLNWTEPLEKLLPADLKLLNAKQKKITLQQLTSHYAGFDENPSKGWWSLNGNATPAKLRANALEALLKETPIAEPGEKHAYSNMSYVMAGIVAQKVAKKDWEVLMQERLFKPLNITTAGFGIPGKTSGPADQPRGHNDKGICQPTVDNPQLMGPAGTVHMSILDWAKFGQDFLNGALGEKANLKPESYQTLLSTPFDNKSYSLGGWIASQHIYGHDGSNTLNYCSILMNTKLKWVLLVTCNQGGDPGQKAVQQVMRDLAKLADK